VITPVIPQGNKIYIMCQAYHEIEAWRDWEYLNQPNAADAK